MNTQAQGHYPYTYYGEQTSTYYSPQIRPHDTGAWPHDMYSSPGVTRSHQSIPANSWTHQVPQNPYGTQYAPLQAQWDAPSTTSQGSPYHSYTSTTSAPAPEPSGWQPANTSTMHTYERLPSADKDVVDGWLAKDSERRVYRCRAEGCGKEFSSKDNARVHVHGKHLGESKLFRCIRCRTEFASEDGAKRHRDTATTKTFSCTYCSNTYARKDYRDLHQKKCISRGTY